MENRNLFNETLNLLDEKCGERENCINTDNFHNVLKDFSSNQEQKEFQNSHWGSNLSKNSTLRNCLQAQSLPNVDKLYLVHISKRDISPHKTLPSSTECISNNHICERKLCKCKIRCDERFSHHSAFHKSLPSFFRWNSVNAGNFGQNNDKLCQYHSTHLLPNHMGLNSDKNIEIDWDCNVEDRFPDLQSSDIASDMQPDYQDLHSIIRTLKSSQTNVQATGELVASSDVAADLACVEDRLQETDGLLPKNSIVHIYALPHSDQSENSSEQFICRICHSGGEEELISPCGCSGSSRFVHESCLVTWFKKTVKKQCELCQAIVDIKKKNKNISVWRKPEDSPVPLIWFSVFFIGLFLNVLSIYVNASERCKSTACLIFYVVNGFGIVLDAAFLWFWFLKCLFYWRKWCALNQEWSIQSRANARRPGSLRKLPSLSSRESASDDYVQVEFVRGEPV